MAMNGEFLNGLCNQILLALAVEFPKQFFQYLFRNQGSVAGVLEGFH